MEDGPWEDFGSAEGSVKARERVAVPSGNSYTVGRADG